MIGILLLFLQTILPPASIRAVVFSPGLSAGMEIEWATTPTDAEIRSMAPTIKPGIAVVTAECSGIGKTGKLKGCRIDHAGDPAFDALAHSTLRQLRTTQGFADRWHGRADQIFISLRFHVPGSDHAWTNCLPFCIATPPPPPPPAPSGPPRR